MEALDMFINGGLFMWPIFACLVLGISFSLMKFWMLYRSQQTFEMNSDLYQNLNMNHQIIQNEVEKIYTNETFELDKGMSFLATLISLAPMFGFTGTVYGMIIAFKKIKEVKDINPAIVAEGIETALLTTLFGLVVAMILQILYNYFDSSNRKSESTIINNLMNFSTKLLSRNEG